MYKRAVGYFRSSVLLVIGHSIVEFARRGGKIQLICSPELAPHDIDSIAAGYDKRRSLLEDSIISEIETMLSESATSVPTRVLATLVSVGSLDIKLALPTDRKGIYHEKIGIFRDELGNRVSFKGSANETWSGWHAQGNFESIEVFCNWRGGLEEERVNRHESHFDSLWSEKDTDVGVFPFPSKATELLKRAAFANGFDDLERMPLVVTATGRCALEHQTAALAGWAAQSFRGILQHATGSGKTFTALLAIREHAQRCQPTLILVPSTLLLDQWANEIRQEIPGTPLLLAGGGNVDWKIRGRLRAMTEDSVALGGRIVLATMATASSPLFISSLSAGPHLLLVVDECHQLGSAVNSQFMNIDAGRRLGLSATPTRYGDPVGTKTLMEYFGGVVPPPITLNDAIAAGRLVEYEYFPHAIHLNAQEAEDWKKLSREISLEIARSREDSNGHKALSDRAKMLLIRRSRIAKKASGKIRLAAAILKREYVEGQHWLVYCEDAEQLGEVMSAVRAEGLQPTEYHSSMQGDRDAALSWFKKFGGPLISIRCLDEGVDIPTISHALILASSQNPRQFIQRRGRVLRTAHGKTLATIHDAIVVPVNLDEEPEQTSLLKSELLRAIEFANNAINRGAAAELRAIAINLGLNPDSLTETGVEEEEDARRE